MESTGRDGMSGEGNGVLFSRLTKNILYVFYQGCVILSMSILCFNILSLYILRFPLWIIFRITTVVGEFINIMKTTLDFNFDLYQAFKKPGFTKTWKQREAVNQKSFSLVTCKFVTRTKAKP